MPATRPGLRLDEAGVCTACRWAEAKKEIDWDARRVELEQVADWARREAEGPWHCVVGVSGGKDSTWQALYVRHQLRLNPLLVQFASSDGTEVGRQNIENLVELGFSLITVQPNPQVAQALSRKSFHEFGNIVKYSEFALFSIPFRTAMNHGIPLVFFGENPSLEAGDRNLKGAGWDATTIKDNNTLGGANLEIWLDDTITERDLIQYRFPSDEEFDAWGGRGVFMGYYLNWSGYQNAVFAIRHGLDCLDADYRDIGIHYAHNSLDSANGGIVNAMLKHVKLGFGNTTEFACYDIRDGRITRAEAIRLVKELDGRCHSRFVGDYCDWIGITEAAFWRVTDSYRGPMWRHDKSGNWRLEEPIWEQEPYADAADLHALLQRLDTRRLAREAGPATR